MATVAANQSVVPLSHVNEQVTIQISQPNKPHVFTCCKPAISNHIQICLEEWALSLSLFAFWFQSELIRHNTISFSYNKPAPIDQYRNRSGNMLSVSPRSYGMSITLVLVQRFFLSACCHMLWWCTLRSAQRCHELYVFIRMSV